MHSVIERKQNARAKEVGTELDNLFFVRYFRKQGRRFPWREPGVSPFAFMITEMLLRQTLASNVGTMWSEFLKHYPTPARLMRASRKDLKRRIERLGFSNQRSEALVLASSYLVSEHGGTVPEDLESLLQIPHIGMYAARAILCFAFGKRIEIVDTNVLRFYARYYGLEIKPDIRRNPAIWRIAKDALPRTGRLVQQHNYGLLDFTAEVCKSSNPLCFSCPLVLVCKFGSERLSQAQGFK